MRITTEDSLICAWERLLHLENFCLAVTHLQFLIYVCFYYSRPPQQLLHSFLYVSHSFLFTRLVPLFCVVDT